MNIQSLIQGIITGMGSTPVTVLPDVTAEQRDNDRYATIEVSSANEVLEGNYTYSMNMTLTVYCRPDLQVDMDDVKLSMTNALRGSLGKLKTGELTAEGGDWRVLDYSMVPGAVASDNYGLRMAVPFTVVVQF